MKAIISVNNKYYIGKNNRMMWYSEKDMAHFKKMTLRSNKGNITPVLLVGYNTFQNLPELKGRHVILDTEEVMDVRNIDWIIGGAKTIEKYKEYITEYHISYVDNDCIGDVSMNNEFTNIAFNTNAKVERYYFNDSIPTEPYIYKGVDRAGLINGEIYDLTVNVGDVVSVRYRKSLIIYESIEELSRYWKKVECGDKANEDDNFFKKATSSIADLLRYKNKLYGNSVLEPLNIFSGKTKSGVALDTKLSRVKNSESLRKNDVADIIGYLILACKENGWDDFSEFKD